MRPLIFLFLMIVSVSKLNAQSVDMNIKLYTSYYYNNDRYNIRELTLTNLSIDTLIVWITDSVKNHNETQSIYDYFFKQKGDMSLSNIIYDGNVSEVLTVIGDTFIKEIPPDNAFTIFFIDSCNKNDDYYLEFVKNKIVSIKKSSLRPFNFTNFPIWHQLLFRNDTIILSNK